MRPLFVQIIRLNATCTSICNVQNTVHKKKWMGGPCTLARTQGMLKTILALQQLRKTGRGPDVVRAMDAADTIPWCTENEVLLVVTVIDDTMTPGKIARMSPKTSTFEEVCIASYHSTACQHHSATSSGSHGHLVTHTSHVHHVMLPAVPVCKPWVCHKP